MTLLLLGIEYRAVLEDVSRTGDCFEQPIALVAQSVTIARWRDDLWRHMHVVRDNIFEVMTLEELKAMKGKISPAVAATIRHEAAKIADLTLRNHVLAAVDANNEKLAVDLLFGPGGPLNSAS